MANTQHLEILHRGVRDWNAWRTTCSDTPDLKGVNLASSFESNLDLSDVDFRGADLRRARFDRANLSGADFRGANLNGAYLIGSYLTKASLSDATIADYANLVGANLSHADLSGASFDSADFSGASLPYAKLKKTNLTRANFRNANATPLLSKEDISGRLRSYFGNSTPDLSDEEMGELRKLCAVFLTVTANAAVMEKERTKAFLQAKLPSIQRANLEEIFQRCGEVELELIAQLSSDIEGMRGADFSGANLTEANLSGAWLGRADLSHANLSKAVLVGTDLRFADLTGAAVYGIAAWDVNLEGAVQKDLSISPPSITGSSLLRVDQIEVAQFLYLLLNNAAIRRIIDTITSKVVLILGRFTSERKALLEGIKNELRRRNYVPVLFDFEGPSSQTLSETVETLAHMARFIIADLTDAKSILQELRGIVPDHPSVPVQPLLLAGQSEPGMIDFFKRYPWFLDIALYENQEKLLEDLPERVIEPAELKWKENTKF